MTRTPVGIAFATLLATAAFAQTSTTPRRTATHRPSKATSSAGEKPAAVPVNPADNPPNVPPVEGSPKPLYALRYVDSVVGTGDLASPRKWYSVRYTGWLTDGTKFDSSEDHPGKPFAFPYGARRVILGWDTGFEGMRVGGKRRLYIPYQLAYGEAGRPGIPPKADLIFDLELVAISDTDPNAAPEPTATQPPDSIPTTPPDTPPGTPPDTTKLPADSADPTKPTSASPPPSSNPRKPQTTPPPPK